MIDLGKGANMRGAASPFDIGVEFGTPGNGKDDIQLTSFTLSNGAGDLTLDDIAQVDFGVRLTSIGEMGGARGGSSKGTVVAPAAPTAVVDAYDIFEDGQDGLDDPAASAEGMLFEVLENDSDADGDTLTITSVHGASRGTVEIVDGADDDTLPGDAILYTPTDDYAGPDEFVYCISDGNGGTAFATVQVAIEAVADVPDVGIEAFATGNVNEVRLVVTATQTDDSGSEFIRNIIASELPAGVTLTPASIATPTGEPDEFVQEYILTLPMDQDTDFDLTFTATSVEESNLDSETGALLTDAFFNTVGPSGSYTLDFIWGILLQAYASIDVDFGSINFDPLGIIPGDQTVDLGGIDETVNFPAIDIGPGSVNVIDIDSSDLGGSFTFPAPADSLSVDFAWPNIETTSGAAVDPATSSGESENFLQLNLDIDQLVTQLAGLPVNPFNPGTDIAGGACLRRT